MTKQILAFLFCFKRELNQYFPLTYSLFLRDLQRRNFFFKILCYEVFAKQKKKKEPTNNYLCVCVLTGRNYDQ